MGGPTRDTHARCTRLAAVVLPVWLAGASCLAFGEIDHLEFGRGTTTGTTTGTAGTGGTGGGAAGGGGSASCSDGQHNGEETGIDCGGPDCEPCAEDCTNGVDDNGDELVDCADPICGGYECAAPVPEGWTGPVAFFAGPASSAVPACDPAFPEAQEGGVGDPSAPAAECSDCECGPPSGGTCHVVVLTLFSDDVCAGQSGGYILSAGSDICESWATSGIDSLTAGPIVASGATCAPSGGEPTLPPVGWSMPARLCSGTTAGKGCAEPGELCVRSPTLPFRLHHCVVRAGEHQCPAAAYPERTVVHTGIDDSRDCWECGCAHADDRTCEGHVTAYNDSLCEQGGTNVPTDGTTCTARSNASSAKFTATSSPSGGSCTTLGGNPTGTVTAADPVTVCCGSG